MIVGNHTSIPDATTAGVPGTLVGTATLTMPEAGLVAKLSALLDGGGPGSGVQTLHGGIWTPSGALVALSEPLEMDAIQPEGWHDLTFAEPVNLAAGAEVVLGIVFGSFEIARWRSTEGSAGFAVSHETPGEDFDPEAVSEGDEPLMFATYATNPALAVEEDLYYATLGFYSAQEKLGETEASGTRYEMAAGWHGTWLDPEPQGASLAIIDRASEHAEALTGERIRITHRGRSVVVYVHRETDLDSDGIELSLSRRAFAALTVLSQEELNVVVEVLD